MFGHIVVIDLCVWPHFRVKMWLFDEDSSVFRHIFAAQGRFSAAFVRVSPHVRVKA